MPSLTPTTDLEAVNIMLGTIGEAPVSTLEVSGLSDVAIAKQVLHELSRTIQTRGWHFNSEIDYPLSPTVDGFLLPPTNTLRIDVTKEYWDVDVVHRGTKLYDRINRTSVFTRELKFDLVLYLDFMDLPEAARNYITIRAARVFQRRILGSPELESYTQDEESFALVNLLEAEGDTGDSNMFTGSYSVASIIER